MSDATTQEMYSDVPTRQNETNAFGNAAGYGDRGKPVGFLQIKQWSRTSNRMDAYDDELATLYPIFNGNNSIGRSKQASIWFPFSAISARHACIDVKETLHTIRDCCSTNATKRNGVGLDSDVRYEIFDRTHLWIADIECIYHIGDVSDFDEADGLKIDDGLDRKFKEQDSIGASTTATAEILFKNFLSGDDEEPEPKRKNSSTSKHSSCFAIPAPPRKTTTTDAAAHLGVLVEESQLMTDERQSMDSMFRTSEYHPPQVVRETEQLLPDDDDERNENDGKHDTGNINIDNAENHLSNVVEEQSNNNAEIADESRKRSVSMMGIESSKEDDSLNSAVDTTDRSGAATSNGVSLIEEAIQADATSPDPGETRKPVTAGASGLPIPLNPLKVDCHLTGIAMTPATSIAGKTPQTNVGTCERTVGRNHTSVWSVKSSNVSSTNRTGQQKRRSLTDNDPDDFLFKSEPSGRRKKARATVSDGSRRRATAEQPSRFYQLQQTVANSYKKDMSDEKKAMSKERSASDESIAQLASEISAKVKDPFEFPDSQPMSFPLNMDDSMTSNADPPPESSKKTQRGRKTVKPSRTSKNEEATSTNKLTDRIGQKGRSMTGDAMDKWRLRNESSSTTGTSSATSEIKKEAAEDEAKFDQAAMISRQVRCPAKTKGTQDPKKPKDPQPSQRQKRSKKGEKPSESSTDDVQPKKSRKEDDVAEQGIKNADESESGPSKSKIIKPVEDAKPKDNAVDVVEVDTKNDAEPKVDEQPKRRGRKKKADVEEKQSMPSDKLDKDSDELSDLIYPEKPTQKKAVGRPKAAKTTTEKPTSKAPKKAAAAKREDAPTVKICFSGTAKKLEELKEAVKDLKGEVVDSGTDCTHLVVPKFGRSVKVMCAVARGAPIVIPEWVEASKKAGRFVDTEEYILSDKVEEKRLEFKLRECLADARKRIEESNEGLLDGYVVYSTASVRPNREEMKAIVTCAGGRFLDRLPKSARKDGQFVALSCEADEKTEDIKRLRAMRSPIVSIEFILSGLLKREINVDKYKMFESPIDEPTTTSEDAPKSRKQTKVESSQASSAESSKPSRTARGKK